MKLAACLVLLTLTSPWALSQSWKNTSCLPPEDQQALLVSFKQLSEQFQLQAKKERLLAVSAKRQPLFAEANDCRRRLDSAFEMLGAVSDGCHQTIQRYNSLVQQENDAEANLQSAQKIVIGQLELERAAYPACR